MKALYLGTAIAVIVIIVSLIQGDMGLITKYSGYVSVGALMLAAIFSGIFLTGGQLRGNLYTESKKDRQERMSWTISLIFIAIPNFLLVLMIYFLF